MKKIILLLLAAAAQNFVQSGNLQAGQTFASTSTCSLPANTTTAGIAYDGRYQWIADITNNRVFKLDPINCTVVGTYPTGFEPHYVVIAGGRVYICNQGENTVTILTVATGAPVANSPVAVGHNPYALYWDGTYVYVSCANDGSVWRILDSTQSVFGSPLKVGSAATGNTRGIAGDLQNLYVVSDLDRTVTFVRISSFTTIATVAVGAVPSNALVDGSGRVWVTNHGDDTISAISIATQSVIGTFPAGVNPYAMVLVPPYIFIVNHNAGMAVTQLDMNGTLVATIPLAGDPLYIDTDGTYLWVTDEAGSLLNWVLPGLVASMNSSSATLSAAGPLRSLPASCGVSQIYFATDATAGRNLYFCTAPNVWTQQN